MRSLWTAAVHLMLRWDQLQEHPACAEYQQQLARQMKRLKAAITVAQPSMDLPVFPESQ